MHLFRAEAREVLLVDSDGGTGSSRTAVTTTGSGATTTATGATAAATATAATAARSVRTAAGRLDKTHVDIDVLLLLALLLALGLLRAALDVLLFLLVALELLGGRPLLVGLGALIRSARSLGAQIAALLGKLREVIGVRLGLVGRLLGRLLAGRGLGLVLVGLGNILGGPLVVPRLVTSLPTPALTDLLAGVTVLMW